MRDRPTLSARDLLIVLSVAIFATGCGGGGRTADGSSGSFMANGRGLSTRAPPSRTITAVVDNGRSVCLAQVAASGASDTDEDDKAPPDKDAARETFSACLVEKGWSDGLALIEALKEFPLEAGKTDTIPADTGSIPP